MSSLADTAAETATTGYGLIFREYALEIIPLMDPIQRTFFQRPAEVDDTSSETVSDSRPSQGLKLDDTSTETLFIPGRFNWLKVGDNGPMMLGLQTIQTPEGRRRLCNSLPLARNYWVVGAFDI